MAKRKRNETSTAELAREAKFASQAALEGRTIDEVRAAADVTRRGREDELLAGRVDVAGRRLQTGFERTRVAGEALADRLTTEAAGRRDEPQFGDAERAELETAITAARTNPTPATTRFAVDTLVSFPDEDIFFGDFPVDKTSRKTLNSIHNINNLLSQGLITLDEASERIEPLREQLKGTARRRDARAAPARRGEFLAATEETATVADDRARTSLAEAETRRDTLVTQISTATTSTEEGGNANALAVLNRQLSEANEAAKKVRLKHFPRL